MELILIGKIINFFGIKGELKVASDFEYPEKVFKKDFVVQIKNQKHKITNVRYHKNHYLIQIDNLEDINLVLNFKGLELYIARENLSLAKDEYLFTDLVTLDVYDNDELIGKITEVINNSHNPLIKVNNQFYIPLKANYITKVDFKNRKIITENIRGLML